MKKPITERAKETVNALENATKILREELIAEKPDLIKVDKHVSEAELMAIELRNLEFITPEDGEDSLEMHNFEKSELNYRFIDTYEVFVITLREFEYKYPTPIEFIVPSKTDSIH